MIVGFRCQHTERLHRGERVRKFLSIEAVARRTLTMLDAAATLADLAMPPGNRLEELKGDRTGQHSIRINDQFRVCFVWTRNGPDRVELVDYHR